VAATLAMFRRVDDCIGERLIAAEVIAVHRALTASCPSRRAGRRQTRANSTVVHKSEDSIQMASQDRVDDVAFPIDVAAESVIEKSSANAASAGAGPCSSRRRSTLSPVSHGRLAVGRGIGVLRAQQRRERKTDHTARSSSTWRRTSWARSLHEFRIQHEGATLWQLERTEFKHGELRRPMFPPLNDG